MGTQKLTVFQTIIAVRTRVFAGGGITCGFFFLGGEELCGTFFPLISLLGTPTTSGAT